MMNEDRSKVQVPIEKRKERMELLQRLFETVMQNKKDLALWLGEIQDPDIMTDALRCNDQVQLAIRDYIEYTTSQKEKEDKKKESLNTSNVEQQQEGQIHKVDDVN